MNPEIREYTAREIVVGDPEECLKVRILFPGGLSEEQVEAVNREITRTAEALTLILQNRFSLPATS